MRALRRVDTVALILAWLSNGETMFDVADAAADVKQIHAFCTPMLEP